MLFRSSLIDQPESARRRALAFGGAAVMVGIGVALVMWRTIDIRTLPGFGQLFG